MQAQPGPLLLELVESLGLPGPLLLGLAGLVVEELGLLLLEVQFEGLEPELWPLEQPEQELGFEGLAEPLEQPEQPEQELGLAAAAEAEAEAEFAAMGFLTPLCFLFWAA